MTKQQALARQQAYEKRMHRPLTLGEVLDAAKNILNMIHLVETMLKKSGDPRERENLREKLSVLYLKAEKMGEVLQMIRKELKI